MHPHGCYGYGTNHHLDNLLGSKKMSGQKDMLNVTIKSSNYLGGKQLLDDGRRGMLDSAKQAEAGDRQHDERGGQAMMQDKRVMDNVR